MTFTDEKHHINPSAARVTIDAFARPIELRLQGIMHLQGFSPLRWQTEKNQALCHVQFRLQGLEGQPVLRIFNHHLPAALFQAQIKQFTELLSKEGLVSAEPRGRITPPGISYETDEPNAEVVSIRFAPMPPSQLNLRLTAIYHEIETENRALFGIQSPDKQR